jgi:hypothetical protein
VIARTVATKVAGFAASAIAAKSVVSARRTMMKREVVTFDETDRIVGSRPEHVHRNPDLNAKIREWACNSP